MTHIIAPTEMTLDLQRLFENARSTRERCDKTCDGDAVLPPQNQCIWNWPICNKCRCFVEDEDEDEDEDEEEAFDFNPDIGLMVFPNPIILAGSIK